MVFYWIFSVYERRYDAISMISAISWRRRMTWLSSLTDRYAHSKLDVWLAKQFELSRQVFVIFREMTSKWMKRRSEFRITLLPKSRIVPYLERSPKYEFTGWHSGLMNTSRVEFSHGSNFLRTPSVWFTRRLLYLKWYLYRRCRTCHKKF